MNARESANIQKNGLRTASRGRAIIHARASSAAIIPKYPPSLEAQRSRGDDVAKNAGVKNSNMVCAE